MRLSSNLARICLERVYIHARAGARSRIYVCVYARVRAYIYARGNYTTFAQRVAETASARCAHDVRAARCRDCKRALHARCSRSALQKLQARAACPSYNFEDNARAHPQDGARGHLKQLRYNSAQRSALLPRQSFEWMMPHGYDTSYTRDVNNTGLMSMIDIIDMDGVIDTILERCPLEVIASRGVL